MKLHILGVNGPFPESGGATSGYLLETGDSLIQFDFGCGILSRLTMLTAPETLTALLISHWHYDHTSDLAVLMYRLQAMNAVLPVYAPADPLSPVRKLIADTPCFELHEIAPGQEIILGGCRILVGPARHPVPAVGFRAEAEGRSFGYTGDTNTLPSLAGFYTGCHLLLADGLFPADVWNEGVPHLSAALAANLAGEAHADHLVLTHFNPVYSPRMLLREAQERHHHVSLATAGSMMEV